MNILLDTNMLLRVLDETGKVPDAVLTILRDRTNRVLFSAINIWEIGIKATLGRQDFPYDAIKTMRTAVDVGLTELPITAAVAATVANLPFHHRDPFDRLLVAQAIAMPARLYTTDRRLPAYSELVTLVR